MSSNVESQIKSIITIPEYVMKFIDRRINLDDTPKICCLFHEESTPSFSYSPDKGLWRCFGSCGFGGDVIAMHQKYHRLKNRKEAIESLAMMFKIDVNEVRFDVDPKESVDQNLVKLKSLLVSAENSCKNISDYLALDYLMSFNKPYKDLIDDLDTFITLRTN